MKILREALIALNDWVMDGLPDHNFFSPYDALCENVSNFIRQDQRCKSNEWTTDDFCNSLEELQSLFLRDGYRKCPFPFNYDKDDWNREKELGHLFITNTKRLDFLKKHGTRAISDCVPLALRTEYPEIFVLANIYLRGEDVY